jgi:hypothetical protein
MGECGCGSREFDKAYQIGKTKTTLGVELVPGCRDCGYGPGVFLSLFDTPDNEFLNGLKPKKVTPDEYGCNKGVGIGVPVFDIEDLQKAAAEIEKKESGPAAGYESFEEWLGEFGYHLVERAIELRRKRR